MFSLAGSTFSLSSATAVAELKYSGSFFLLDAFYKHVGTLLNWRGWTRNTTRKKESQNHGKAPTGLHPIPYPVHSASTASFKFFKLQEMINTAQEHPCKFGSSECDPIFQLSKERSSVAVVSQSRSHTYYLLQDERLGYVQFMMPIYINFCISVWMNQSTELNLSLQYKAAISKSVVLLLLR